MPFGICNYAERLGPRDGVHREPQRAIRPSAGAGRRRRSGRAAPRSTPRCPPGTTGSWRWFCPNDAELEGTSTIDRREMALVLCDDRRADRSGRESDQHIAREPESTPDLIALSFLEPAEHVPSFLAHPLGRHDDSSGTSERREESANQPSIPLSERARVQFHDDDTAQICDSARLKQHILVPPVVDPVDVQIRVDDDATHSGKDPSDTVKGMRIHEVLTAAHSPWQNPFAERLIGSVRHEYLDHVLVLSERHLRRILTRDFAYYHPARTHLSLEKDAPDMRPIQRPEMGAIVAILKSVACIIATSAGRPDLRSPTPAPPARLGTPFRQIAHCPTPSSASSGAGPELPTARPPVRCLQSPGVPGESGDGTSVAGFGSVTRCDVPEPVSNPFGTRNAPRSCVTLKRSPSRTVKRSARGYTGCTVGPPGVHSRGSFPVEGPSIPRTVSPRESAAVAWRSSCVQNSSGSPSASAARISAVAT
jgi:hypothetical protein